MSTLTVGTISEKITDAGINIDGATLKDGGATFTSAVGVTGNTTITSGNLVIGTSGNGIDFSANSNASGMTSELLDSYEEGTWTPTDDSGVALNVNPQHSDYVKIGRLVMANTELTIQTNTSGAQVKIGGLPFTVKNPSSTGGFVRYSNSSASTPFVITNQNTDQFIAYAQNGGTIPYSSYSNKRFDVTVIYHTDA